MKALFTIKTENIKKSWDNFIMGANNVNDMLSKLKSISANRETVSADLTNANTIITDKFEGLTPEQGTVLIKKINDFSVQVAVFAREAKTCFDQLMKARGLGFCYGCSAYAAHKAYFSADDGKFTISQASRYAIAAACIKPWAFINGLRGMMQMFAILIWQRDPKISVFPQRPPGGLHYGGVTGPQLYEAFIACPNATVEDACTQAIIDQIVVSQFNLFDTEKYAADVNTNYSVTSSHGSRLLAVTGSATGDVDIGATVSDGADLTIAVKRLPKALTIDTNKLMLIPQAPESPPNPPECTNSSGCTHSSGNIFVMTAIATAATVVSTLN